MEIDKKQFEEIEEFENEEENEEMIQNNKNLK